MLTKSQFPYLHFGLSLVLFATLFLSVPAALMQGVTAASIDLEKYISVDGGMTWLDADATPGPSVEPGDAVLFRVVVTNTGDAELTNVTFTDTQFETSNCSVPETLAAASFFGCDFGPVEAVEGEYTNTATVTANSATGTVTDSDSASYQGEVDDDDDDDLSIVIVIEGPVEEININIIVIYGIEIILDPDDPILTIIEVGDNVRVEGGVESEGDVVIIVAVTVVIIDIDIYIGGDDGDDVWVDDGDCGNPPPPWAPAWGWRRKCEGVIKPKNK